MLKTGRQSTNVIDRRGDTSVSAPHKNPFTNPIINTSRQKDNTMTELGDRLRVQKAERDKSGNPFSKMVQDMPKGVKQDQAAALKARKAGGSPAIPIPTPSPGPNSPLPPKTFGKK